MKVNQLDNPRIFGSNESVRSFSLLFKMGKYLRWTSGARPRVHFILLIFLCLSTGHATNQRIGQFVAPDSFSGKAMKNGIDLRALTKDFSANFKLVSAHFRDDKNQIRMIYANDLGIEGLNSNPQHFQDGAVFYKVVYPTTSDAAFSASLIPGAPTVRQVMVYDEKNFKRYGGWKFAVFNDQGVTLPGEPEQTNSTCFACHQLVESRAFIFSRPLLGISPWTLSEPVKAPLPPPESGALAKDLFKFRIGEMKELPAEIKRMIRGKNSRVNFMIGHIMEQKFTGFVPELVGPLMKQTLASGFASVAVKEIKGESLFSYAYIDDETVGACREKQKTLRFGSGKIMVKNHNNRLRESLKCIP